MFMPEVVQVVPHENYVVDILFQDGKIIEYDAKPLLDKGNFTRLSDIEVFMDTCTVMNHTLAWDLSGIRDVTSCLDIDPEVLYDYTK